MKTENGYNGWSNYETWCVNLWLTNDSGSADWLEETAIEALKDADGDRDDARDALAQTLEQLHDDALADRFPELSRGKGGVFGDLLGAAMSAVDWREIAEAALSDIDVFVSGRNLPGFLPDESPDRCYGSDAQREARDLAAYAMEQDAENVADGIDDVDTPAGSEKAESIAAELRAGAEAARNETGEFSYTIAGRCYFVARA